MEYLRIVKIWLGSYANGMISEHFLVEPAWLLSGLWTG